VAAQDAFDLVVDGTGVADRLRHARRRMQRDDRRDQRDLNPTPPTHGSAPLQSNPAPILAPTRAYGCGGNTTLTEKAPVGGMAAHCTQNAKAADEKEGGRLQAASSHAGILPDRRAQLPPFRQRSRSAWYWSSSFCVSPMSCCTRSATNCWSSAEPNEVDTPVTVLEIATLCTPCTAASTRSSRPRSALSLVTLAWSRRQSFCTFALIRGSSSTRTL